MSAAEKLLLRSSAALAPLFAAAAVPAQGLTVSPAAYATAEANSGSTFPFDQAGRYQQVHGDLRGTSMLIRALGFRRDGDRAHLASATARTLDCEVWMSWASYPAFSMLFDLNHGPVKLNAMFRRTVGLPDNTQPNGRPGPWNVRFPFDQPFPFQGGPFDLLWELRIHANTGRNLPYECDATHEPMSDAATSLGTEYGFGCIAEGRANLLLARSMFRVSAMANTLALSWWLHEATPAAACVMLVGTPANVALGACAPLYVDPMVTLGGRASAQGMFLVPSIVLPWTPAMAGASLAAQGVVAAVPRGTWPIRVVLSNRITTTVPALPPGGGAPIHRLVSHVSPTSEWGNMDGGNFGLVTAFEN